MPSINYENTSKCTKVVRPELSDVLLRYSDHIVKQEVIKNRNGCLNGVNYVSYIDNETIECFKEVRMEIAKYDMVKELMK